MPRRWQLQEAKNRLSEVVDLALEEGPQTVTRHGKEVVVIVAKVDFDRRRKARAPRGSIVRFLRRMSFVKAKLDPTRAKDLDRDLQI
jgi:prevent-host-death family protein